MEGQKSSPGRGDFESDVLALKKFDVGSHGRCSEWWVEEHGWMVWGAADSVVYVVWSAWVVWVVWDASNGRCSCPKTG